jgi:hypothetical protein
MLLFIPFIPIIAVIAIASGSAALIWYYNQSVEKREKADQIAMKWFGKQFKQLASKEQAKIQNHINKIS